MTVLSPTRISGNALNFSNSNIQFRSIDDMVPVFQKACKRVTYDSTLKARRYRFPLLNIYRMVLPGYSLLAIMPASRQHSAVSIQLTAEYYLLSLIAILGQYPHSVSCPAPRIHRTEHWARAWRARHASACLSSNTTLQRESDPFTAIMKY